MSFHSFFRLCNKHITRSSCILLSIITYQNREYMINQNHYRSRCDEIIKEALNKDNNNIKSNKNINDEKYDNNNNNNNDDDDEAWEAEKQSCSVCRQFLQSPCKLPFKNWSKCVDKAKVDSTDFITECSQYTTALMHCTSENAEYFEQAFAQQKNDEGDDIEEENHNTTIENKDNNKIDSQQQQQ